MAKRWVLVGLAVTLAAVTLVTACSVVPPEIGPARARLGLRILGCATTLDLLRGSGEVTDVWVTVQNTGTASAEDVVVTAQSSDETRSHPDKLRTIATLPAGQEWSARLRVDTALGRAGEILVTAVAAGGQEAAVRAASCPQMSADALNAIGPCLEHTVEIGRGCGATPTPTPPPVATASPFPTLPAARTPTPELASGALRRALEALGPARAD